ncbi:MAG: SelT/SelW/SelH family protein [Nitrospinaceae bacterium]|nr:SelT/SelW/SelH family protein [Nitrospinaceae bacterium]MBT4431003.1 SelT/SelW/SelH family protein [Nitrospinaceae bacterium]MBT5366665.1 SelT/SelW/SelH family protein [Nitrospinaceae bacterium]MBT5949116.1 SelT/SelW/SelH family protein [Nitrospinaceae bacterium]MBT6394048.1 SelT/SelW/SelH family protein [Nitrospinaceae bacterium]
MKAAYPGIEIVGNEDGKSRIGAFEVALDGKLVFSHLEQGTWPESADIIRMIGENGG